MHRSTFIMASLAVVAFAAIGCSSSSSGAPPCDTSKPVSYATDVVPILQVSCAATQVCHGVMGLSMPEGFYLGPAGPPGVSPPPWTADEVAASRAAMVGVTAKENTMMNFVTPMDPDTSFLFHKIVGDMNSNPTVANGCVTTNSMCFGCSQSTQPCGVPMPYNSMSLAADQICTFKSWIVQGAKNN
jgi:hypothetical protein